MPRRRSRKCAHAAGREHQNDRGTVADRKIKERDAIDDFALRGRDPRQIFLAPVGVFGKPGDFAPALVRADHCERRHQHRDGEQDGRRPSEERLQPQPEIKPDAGVRPCHRQQDELHRDHVLPENPIGEQRRCVVGRGKAEQRAGEPHRAEMTGEPQRNGQAEHELRNFNRRVAKMAPLIERPQAKREMRDGRGVKRGIDDRNSPPPDVELQPRFHRREEILPSA